MFPYDCRSVSIVLQASPFFPNLYIIFHLLSLKMVQTRSELENLSKDELIDEVLSLEKFKSDIKMKFFELNDRCNEFEAKFKLVEL